MVLSRWERGPELLLSTKTQVSSFAKNVGNRFEEAYGDAANLRGRHPLAAAGFFFLQRASILTDEADAYERTKDMMRKLRDTGSGNGYTATGLLLASWTDDPAAPNVQVQLDPIPEELRPGKFIAALVQQILANTEVDHHVRVRELMERRQLPLVEEDDRAPGED